jgi:DNA replication and repair protein RecF
LNVNIKDIVNFGMKEFYLKSTIQSENKGVFKIKGIFTNGKLNIFASEKKKNIVEINDFYYPLFFSSSNYTAYIESVTLIRKLMDRFIFGINYIYYNELVEYNRALRNKLYLLKNNGSNSELNSWNKVLSEISYKIIIKRIVFINELNKYLKIFNNEMRIEYSPSFFDVNNLTEKKIFYEYEKIKNLEKNYKKNIKGIHLDRYYIKRSNKDLKYFSSGEKKIGLIYVYLSFIEYFFSKRKEYPVFLTDDIDTAIDKNNLKILLENYPKLQVIATSVNKIENYEKNIFIN